MARQASHRPHYDFARAYGLVLVLRFTSDQMMVLGERRLGTEQTDGHQHNKRYAKLGSENSHCSNLL